MSRVNFSAYNNYITDSLYQWDLNQELKVIGLNLEVVPSVYFSNANMDRAIPGDVSVENHIITAKIPNSLLQYPLTIRAYVCIVEDKTFKTIEKISIPVIPRKKPLDYKLEMSDFEVYSFARLENLLANKADNARVDNIIAHNNDTDGNTELIDIRVGADSTIYESAGEHIRAIEQRIGGGQSGKGISSTSASLLIDILRSIGAFTDDDVATKITALEVALNQNTSSGSGDAGTDVHGDDDTGGDTTVENPTEWLTDGLLGLFDFRNAEPVIDKSAGKTTFNATTGNGSFSTWSATAMTSTDDYGSVLSRSWPYSGVNYGNSFTWFIKYYACNRSVAYPSDYMNYNNLTLIQYKPKYNKASGKAQVAPEELGSRESDIYRDIAISVNGNICKLYIDGVLAKTIDGNTIDGFVSWDNTLTLGFNNNPKLTFVGIWDRAFSDAEITYTRLCSKNLEVV